MPKEIVNATSFVPLYDVEIGNADEKTREARVELLKVGLPEDAEMLVLRLEMKFVGNMELVPPSMRGLIPPNAGEDFRKEHYYEELANIIGERQQGKKLKVLFMFVPMLRR
jgi:hypothetical protein